MSTKKQAVCERKEQSFYGLLAAGYLAFSLLFAGAVLAVYFAGGMILNQIAPLPDVAGFLERAREDGINDWGSFRPEEYLGEDALVFVAEDDGRIVFQAGSGAEVSAPDFLSGDPACIPEYVSDQQFLTAQLEDGPQEGGTLIARLEYRENGEAALTGYLLLDRQRRAASGSLFPGKDSFTEEELLWLSGTDREGRRMFRHPLPDENGGGRQLIFCYREPDYRAYIRAGQALNGLWFLLIPAGLLIAGGCTFVLGRRVRRLLAPFDEEIAGFASGRTGRLAGYEGPRELAQIARNFVRMEEKLEKNEEERRKLLADISHDLKTPVTAIRGYAAALRDQLILPGGEGPYLDAIVSRTEQVSRLLSAFHEYSCLDRPGMRADRRKTDLSGMLRDYLAGRYQELQLAGFFLEADLPEWPVFCLLDAALFARAMENLLNNSVAYAGKGRTVFVSLREKGDRAVLSVADNGAGIPEEIREHLFEPFVTGDASRGSAHGSGLGLAIVRQIVLLHGGEIRLEKEPGAGKTTEFVITLPLC